MTFEEWWDFNYVKKGFMGDQPGALGQAFKELALKAWEAGETHGYRLGKEQGREETHRKYL